ncbi:MAG: hypothetical protein CMO01_19675 [Thalassobius sp.]|nr:hypothetical protein [Thalassovita sp.]
MHKYLFFFSFSLLLGLQITVKAQDADLWKQLAKIKWKSEYNEYIGAEIQLPTFAQEIEALNGKEVEIKGFIIPVDLTGADYLVLSAFPYASCFFCGNAGPESVMEVYLKEEEKFDADSKVTFRGKLKLNYEDSYHLVYMLQDAEPIVIE